MPNLIKLWFHRRVMGMTLSLAASLLALSCSKQPRAFRPPLVVAKVPVQEPPPEFSPPPEITAELPAWEESPLPTAPPQFSPPTPVRATGPAKPTPPRPAPPPSPEIPAAIDPTPAPQLGQIFTPAQIRENRQTLDNYLERVKRAVAIFAVKNLNKDDRATADLVRNFLLQSEQQRDTDLAAAVSLAKRADSLARDLMDRLP